MAGGRPTLADDPRRPPALGRYAGPQHSPGEFRFAAARGALHPDLLLRPNLPHYASARRRQGRDAVPADDGRGVGAASRAALGGSRSGSARRTYLAVLQILRIADLDEFLEIRQAAQGLERRLALDEVDLVRAGASILPQLDRAPEKRQRGVLLRGRLAAASL